jgi:hypothetical protein
VRDHRIEITIVMQQPMIAFDAERADDQVDSLPHRDPTRAQLAVIPGRAHGQGAVEHGYHVETPQAAFDA